MTPQRERLCWLLAAGIPGEESQSYCRRKCGAQGQKERRWNGSERREWEEALQGQSPVARGEMGSALLPFASPALLGSSGSTAFCALTAAAAVAATATAAVWICTAVPLAGKKYGQFDAPKVCCRRQLLTLSMWLAVKMNSPSLNTYSLWGLFSHSLLTTAY